jgi:hypothetical protein
MRHHLSSIPWISTQMNKLFRLMVASTALTAILGGCVVGPMPAAEWVPAHYGPYGGWVSGHWR